MRLQLPKNPVLKGIIVATGTIMVGAVGSGAWEVALKPSSFFLRDKILNVATLGITSYKNSVYENVSKGATNAPAIASYFAIIFLLSIFAMFTHFALNAVIRKYEIKHNKMISKTQENIDILDGKEAPKPDQEKLRADLVELQSELAQTPIKRMRHLGYAMTVFLVIPIVVFFIDHMTYSYTNSAITHYHQLSDIVAPYVDKNKLDEYRSSFAQIRSSEDFKLLIAQMESVAKQRQCRIPTFHAW